MYIVFTSKKSLHLLYNSTYSSLIQAKGGAFDVTAFPDSVGKMNHAPSIECFKAQSHPHRICN